jgi:hypothetical protein
VEAEAAVEVVEAVEAVVGAEAAAVAAAAVAAEAAAVAAGVEVEVEVVVAVAVALPPAGMPRAGRSRCSGCVRLSRPSRLPWGRQWIERATRLRR